MAPTRWDPLRELMDLQDRLARVTGSLGWRDGRGAWLPAVDVFDSREAIVVKADLPGLRAEDVDVRLEENVLTLSGERRADAAPEDEEFYRVERPVGRFERMVALPQGIRSEDCTADFAAGVLTVRVPKSGGPQPRRVPIEAREEERPAAGSAEGD
ncbi:MAG: Hsp20/alpha crystallin family protein [Thermoleophilia bacterium]|nr:Hsp20/alpha crystallin family protein [Thermoleophilia bacterium]